MAKKIINPVEAEKLFKVKFIKQFSGSLNDYKIEVSKLDLKSNNVTRELPENIYKWIQKFKVCKDA